MPEASRLDAIERRLDVLEGGLSRRQSAGLDYGRLSQSDLAALHGEVQHQARSVLTAERRVFPLDLPTADTRGDSVTGYAMGRPTDRLRALRENLKVENDGPNDRPTAVSHFIYARGTGDNHQTATPGCRAEELALIEAGFKPVRNGFHPAAGPLIELRKDLSDYHRGALTCIHVTPEIAEILLKDGWERIP